MTNFIIKCSNVGHRSQITYPTADPLWEHPGPPNCHPYRGNTTLCMSSVGSQISEFAPAYCGAQSGGMPGPQQLSSLPREYYTLHVECWVTNSDLALHTLLRSPVWGHAWRQLIVILTEGILHFACRVLCHKSANSHQPTAEPSLGACLEATNCHPYRGNTTLCMSSVGHRSQITYPTASPVWEDAWRQLIVILTEGILTLHVQCWPPISNYIPYCGPTLGAPWPSVRMTIRRARVLPEWVRSRVCNLRSVANIGHAKLVFPR